MKSQLQNYDIRDVHEHQGILELENVLKKNKKEEEKIHYEDYKEKLLSVTEEEDEGIHTDSDWDENEENN